MKHDLQKKVLGKQYVPYFLYHSFGLFVFISLFQEIFILIMIFFLSRSIILQKVETQYMTPRIGISRSFVSCEKLKELKIVRRIPTEVYSSKKYPKCTWYTFSRNKRQQEFGVLFSIPSIFHCSQMIRKFLSVVSYTKFPLSTV